MTKEKFDRYDLRRESEFIKNDIFNAILGAHDSKILPDHFTELVRQSLILHGAVVRAAILEGCYISAAEGLLNEALISQSINHLVTAVDRHATELAGLVELIEETKTPGPRH
jgi:hypothetical protein